MSAKPKKHAAISSRATIEERIDLIEGIMRRAAWERGRTSRALALQWTCSVGTVNDYAAEAGRRVRAEVTDPDVVSVTVSAALSTIVREGLRDGDRASVIRAGDVWTRIAGARQPERHQVVMTDAEADALIAAAAAEHAKK